MRRNDRATRGYPRRRDRVRDYVRGSLIMIGGFASVAVVLALMA